MNVSLFNCLVVCCCQQYNERMKNRPILRNYRGCSWGKSWSQQNFISSVLKSVTVLKSCSCLDWSTWYLVGSPQYSSFGQIWTEQSYSAESRQSPFFFFCKQTKKLVSVGTWSISLRINKYTFVEQYKGLYSSDVGIRLLMMCCMTTQTHWFWMRTEKMEYSFVGCLHFLLSAFLSHATNEFLVGTIKLKWNVHMQSVGRCLEHPCSHVRNLSHGLLEGTLMEVVEGSASITHLLSPSGFSQQVCGLKPLTFWSQVLHV